MQVKHPSAQLGWMYTFDKDKFTPRSGSGSTFNLQNLESDMQKRFEFGLAQLASVNDRKVQAPINIVPVLFNQQASFPPPENVSIFLSNYQNDGVVIGRIPSIALTIKLTSYDQELEVLFDDRTNGFYLP